MLDFAIDFGFDESRSVEFIIWKSKYMWTQSNPVYETEKFRKVKQLLLNNAVDIEPLKLKYKTWYQCYKPGQTFGFAVMDGHITDHPNYQFIGYPFDLSKAKFETVKVAEQIVL